MEFEKKTGERYIEAEKALEQFLGSIFPGESFTPENKEFLVRYSVLKESDKTNEILKQMKAGFTEGTYYDKYPKVKEAREALQGIRSRYNSVRNRKNADEYPPAFQGAFYECLKWWCKDGQRRCYYCGIDESTSMKVFSAVNDGMELPLLQSKKPAWKKGSLQIDKKDPHPIKGKDVYGNASAKGYGKENCVFACVLCNNAKSDLIGANDFKHFFGGKIKEYWDYVVKEMEKQKEADTQI